MPFIGPWEGQKRRQVENAMSWNTETLLRPGPAVLQAGQPFLMEAVNVYSQPRAAFATDDPLLGACA